MTSFRLLRILGPILFNAYIANTIHTLGYGRTQMPAHINKEKGMQVLLRLSPEMTAMLSQAADRSGRSNTKEALVRLEDHLKSFTDLATPGRRFNADSSEATNK